MIALSIHFKSKILKSCNTEIEQAGLEDMPGKVEYQQTTEERNVREDKPT